MTKMIMPMAKPATVSVSQGGASRPGQHQQRQQEHQVGHERPPISAFVAGNE